MQTKNIQANALPHKNVLEIFRDENIALFWKPGVGDLLCTFGDLTTKLNGNRFFADTPIIKKDWPCLGFVATHPNWYPKDSMIKAIKSASDIIKRYKNITSYGASMGGYAAIKYSKEIGADLTIALCPQWTLDQTKSSKVKVGWGEYFSKEMLGMEISGSDCYGNIFIIYDKYWEKDRWHAENIKRTCENVELINMPWVDHNVTPVLAGTSKLARVINTAKEGDIKSLKKITAEFRRASPIRIKTLLKRTVPKHIKLVAPVAARRMGNQPYPDKVLQKLVNFIPDQLDKSNDIEGMDLFIKSMAKHYPIFSAASSAGSCYEIKRNHPKNFIGTSHGSCLCLSANLETLEHKVSGSNRFKVDIDIFDGRALLYVKIGAAKYYLGLRSDRQISVSNWESTTSTPYFNIEMQDRGRFSIKYNEWYVSARKDGKIFADRTTPSDWEKFSFSASKIND